MFNNTYNVCYDLVKLMDNLMESLLVANKKCDEERKLCNVSLLMRSFMDIKV
jgi:hypothetical protein